MDYQIPDRGQEHEELRTQGIRLTTTGSGGMSEVAPGACLSDRVYGRQNAKDRDHQACASTSPCVATTTSLPPLAIPPHALRSRSLMEPAIDPPYYILVSNSPVSSVTLSVPSSTTFSHPIIEYHYADDSPQGLLPQYPGEHVLVVDYNPDDHGSPAAHSLSADLAVTGLKVTEAPGAGVAESEAPKNTNMYVLETIVMPEEM